MPNTQHTVPNTLISKPNTRNPVPKLSTVWSIFSNIFEGLGIDLGGSESTQFAHSKPNPPCSSLHMRGSRPVGPTPPLGPPFASVRATSRQGGSPAQSRTPHVPPPTGRGSRIFRCLRPDFGKKVLREPGSNRPKIRQTWKWSETIGIDSGGPE